MLCARSLDEVAALRPVWEKFQRHPNTDIDFYLTILNSRPEVQRPHVIVVERPHGVPRLLVVGRIEERPLALQLGYKVINGPRMRMLMILYGGVLGEAAAEDCALALQQIQEMLRDGEIDLVFFNHLAVNSPMYTLATMMPAHICRTDSMPANPHHRLTFPGNYESYLAHLSKNTRKNLRRYSRRLLDEWNGRMRLHCYRNPADLGDIIRDAEEIASKTYQRGLGVGFAASEEMERRLALELNRGWLRAYFIYLDGRPAAFSFLSIYGGVAYANETGYDPAYGEYRIGHYLNERIIEELCEEGTVGALDYGFGDAEYKRAICNEVWDERPVYIFASTLRGINLHTLHSVFGAVGRLGRAVMEKTSLLKLLKRFWRRCLTHTNHLLLLGISLN